jgi:hypothetical protein
MLKATLGLIVLTAVTVATPAMAQVRFDAPGVSVGVGERNHWRGDYDYPRHRSGVVVRSYGDSYAYSRCKTTKVYRPNGSVKIIRRCH